MDSPVTMRRIWCGLIFAAITAIAMWMVVFSKWNLQDNPVASRVVIGYFFFICAGPYWMLYDSWRYERKLTRKLAVFRARWLPLVLLRGVQTT